jgi:hypothetical protein
MEKRKTNEHIQLVNTQTKMNRNKRLIWCKPTEKAKTNRKKLIFIRKKAKRKSTKTIGHNPLVITQLKL